MADQARLGMQWDGQNTYSKGALPEGVNLVDDLHVARQQLGHDRHGPLLQGLRHDRVVCEGQGLRASTHD